MAGVSFPTIELRQLTVWVLAIGIVLAIGFIGYLAFFSSPAGNSFGRTFAENLHADLNEKVSQTKDLEKGLVDLELEMVDRSAADQNEYFLTRQLAASFREELEWLSSKETLVFEELMQTENPVRATELLNQETGLFALYVSVVSLNEYASGRIIVEDKQATLDSVDAIIPELEAKSFLTMGAANQLSAETGLDSNRLQESAKKELADFLEYKKEQFARSEPGSWAAYVEAFKLTGWYFTLLALPENG